MFILGFVILIQRIVTAASSGFNSPEERKKELPESVLVNALFPLISLIRKFHSSAGARFPGMWLWPQPSCVKHSTVKTACSASLQVLQTERYQKLPCDKVVRKVCTFFMVSDVSISSRISQLKSNTRSHKSAGSLDTNWLVGFPLGRFPSQKLRWNDGHSNTWYEKALRKIKTNCAFSGCKILLSLESLLDGWQLTKAAIS